MSPPIIAAIDLYKTFGNTHAVQGVSFEISRGEIFGMLGPNGAGKTTTISMLTGLIESTSGTVRVDGRDAGPQFGGSKIKLGIVPQELALYPTLTAVDNLVFFGRIYGLKGRQLKNRVDQVIEIVGLTDRANDTIDTFSGGMKRRINIAAGLVHEPEIIFLDEPTVGVDPHSRNAIFESIETLNRAGLSILYTTHYMEEAQRLCDRVAIMDHGRIIALDSPKEMIRSLSTSTIRLGLSRTHIDAVHQNANALPDIKAIKQVNNELLIEPYQTQKALISLLEMIQRMDCRITSLEVMEPNLETVFLHLTGKSLRDEML